MISQSDQILSQLRQYDQRKHQLRQNSSLYNSNNSQQQQHNLSTSTSSNDIASKLDQDIDQLELQLEEKLDDPKTTPSFIPLALSDSHPFLDITQSPDQQITNPEYLQQQQQQQPTITHTYTSLKIKDDKPHYVPPINFSSVSSNLYRSGHPQPTNFEFLETLNLKTIIYIGDKTDNYEYYKWISVQDPVISFHYFRMQPPSNFASGHQFNDEVALNNILNLIVNKKNYPILIHSNKGKHRVGVLVGLIRKFLQGWSLSGIFDEYGKFAREKGEGDMEFIEMFKPVLKIDVNNKPDFVRIDYE